MSVELCWDRNTEADVSGYRIYRALASGAFEKLADLSQIPSYSDERVEHGRTCQHAVIAEGPCANADPGTGRSRVRKTCRRIADSQLLRPTCGARQDYRYPVSAEGLCANAAPAPVELSSDRNTEPDLPSYRVHWTLAGGDFENLADGSQIPNYSDQRVGRQDLPLRLDRGRRSLRYDCGRSPP